MQKNQQYSSFQNSLNKVYTALKVFLENVTYIYESSGITFDAKKNENIFIRLLLPEQNFRGVDWWELKREKQAKKIKMEQKAFSYQNSHHLKSNNTQALWSQGEREPKLHEPYSNSDRFIKARPSIDHQMQEKVYYWAMEQFQKGARVQMVELRKAAINWAKNKDFQGSTGWCSNFLNRYEDLKELVKNKDRRRPSMNRGPQMMNNQLSQRFRPDQELVTQSKWNQEPNNSTFNHESEGVSSPLNVVSDSDDSNQFDNISVVDDDDQNEDEGKEHEKNVGRRKEEGQ